MKIYKKYICLYLLSLIAVSITYSQSNNFFTISSEGNSPQILSLIKHSKGYFIAGTNDGLYRFDGHAFTPYLFNKAIKNKAISAIAEDKDHTVWLGFQDGEIGFLKNKTVELLKAEEGHPAVAITSILADTTGTVFFATAGEGIYYYRNGRFINVNMDDGLSDNYVYKMLPYDEGIITGTDKGINTVSIKSGRKVITTFTSAKGLPDNIVRCMYVDNVQVNHNEFLVGMQDKGVGKYVPANATPFTSIAKWSYGQVNSIIKAGNEVWAATEGSGVISMLFDKDWTTPISSSIINNTYGKTNNLVQDGEGNVWFTSQEKLVKTNGALLQNIIPFDAKFFTEVHVILVDKNGNIWINNSHGLIKYSYSTQSQQWISKDYILSEINNKTDITSLYEDLFGNIWIGTMGRGVVIIDPISGRHRNLTEQHLLVDGSVLSVSGKDNEIWISSLGGIVHCNLSDENKDISKTYTFIDFKNVSSNIGSNYIYSVFIDSKERVWFATDGRGITVYDHGRFKNYNESNGIKSQVIYNVCEDKNGNIWFSALNNGLYKYDGKKFVNISIEQGLNDATITALASDEKNNIIAISKKGINIVNAVTNSVSYLDDNQGLEEINTDLNCISVNNGVYFISNKGVLKYMPTAETLKPKIVLDGVQLFLSDIDFEHKNEFAHDENNLTFSYFGISYSHPDKLRFQYKLEGLSDEWITTKDNHINFPKLPPGHYTFRVSASINNQFHGSEEVLYSFTITRPIWLQWWFLILSGALIITGLYFYIKSREKQVKRWERLEKEKVQSQFETLKSQVNPHFLFNSFNTLISVIEEDQESAVEYVEHLSDLYRKIVTYRDKDIITIKEELDIIQDYFFIQKKRFGGNLVFENQLNEQEQSNYMIAPLTLQLLTENAVKHNAISSETPLVIELTIADRYLRVKNNINPKFTKEKGAGMGLQNIEKRYQLLTNENVSIQQNEKDFIVNVPLLTA